MSSKSNRITDFSGPVETLARKLLGRYIVRRFKEPGSGNHHYLVGRIVETEAYNADDPTSHSYGNRITPRNRSMFLSAGHLYVYLIYGIHHCLNISAESAGQGAAVLIRALQPIAGIEIMQKLRQTKQKAIKPVDLCNGPGKLTRALAIDRNMDGYNLLESTEIYLSSHEQIQDRINTENDFVVIKQPRPDEKILSAPRIGINGPDEYIQAHLRFYLSNNPDDRIRQN